MVVWIEIASLYGSGNGIQVTTCVVVWIEISMVETVAGAIDVTTCVVVWIEMYTQQAPVWPAPRHHLRGGVD